MRPSAEEYAAGREYLEHDHARRNLSGEPAQAAHRNAQEIEREHPRASRIALAGTSDELGGLPTQLRRHQRAWRAAAGISSRQAAEIRRRGYEDSPDLSWRTPRQRARENIGVAGRQGRELAGAGAGLVGDSSIGELVLDFFMWGALLSIGYLLITKAAAASKLAEGATNAVRAVISPVVDPLHPKGIA